MTATVLYLRHALTPQRRRVEHVAPRAIRALAPDWTRPHLAVLNGKPILRADWDRVLHHGDTLAFVDVAGIPQGGDGGESNPLQIILMIAVMYYAPMLGENFAWGQAANGAITTTQFASYAGMASAAYSVAGMALISMLIPPPKPPTPMQAAALAAPSPTYSLQAQGNQARLEAAIPEHFGRHVAYPDFAAQPYQEYAGNEQYLYQLLAIGRGEYDIEAIRIEDTPISSFAEISYEVIPPNGSLSLFPANVVSSIEVSGQDLPTGTYIGPFVASAAGTQANYLGIDYVLPRGLYLANESTGALEEIDLTVQAEAQAIDDDGAPLGAWFVLGSQTISAATTTPQRFSYRYAVAAGRYQARVKRIDTECTAANCGHDLIWGGLRAYLPDTRTFGDVTLLAMRLRASNNLTMQASRKINVIATRKLPIWNGATWSGNTTTRSIAWAFAYACKQVGLTDAQIDLATLLSLDATWTARGDHFDARFDNFLSFWEAVSKIAAAGRAKAYMQAGVVRIMRDQAASLPVALFSMRNIARGSFSIDYLMPTADTADAIDVGYFDAATWAPRRVRAKLPGSVAARPAKVELFGVVDRNHAFREGMYQAASNRYRRKIIKFATEMEGFIPSFGDLIAIQHDLPAWGQHAEATAWNATTRALTLSEPVSFGAGTHYIGLRRRDGGIDGPHVVTAGATDHEVILATPPAFTPYTAGDEERTHVAFGAGETWRQPARVIAVRPRGLYGVEIEAVNEDDNVHTAETGQTAPAAQTSQLANYTNAPVVLGLLARSSPSDPTVMLLTWQPSAWADRYLIEASSDGANWTRIGETGANNFTAQALYGNATIVRVAAVGIAKGPWVQVHYGQAADYMWSAVDTTLMWNAIDTTLMWSY